MELELADDLRQRLTSKAPGWDFNLSLTPVPTEQPKLYLVEDPQTQCKWYVIYGWIITAENVSLLRGALVYRGPAFANESGPVETFDSGYSILVDYFGDRMITPLLKYPPAKHEYIEHPTYSGPGCATCGQPEPGHKAKKA